MIIWETSFITQNLIKYLSQIKSAIACTCIRTHCIINIKKEVSYERMERIFI